MSDSYVTSTATLKCPFGSACSSLIVLPTKRVLLSGKPMANIKDSKSIMNVPPFGLCSSLLNPTVALASAAAMSIPMPSMSSIIDNVINGSDDEDSSSTINLNVVSMPCIPNIVGNWKHGKADYIVGGQPALLKSCKLTCMWGGVITIKKDGQ